MAPGVDAVDVRTPFEDFEVRVERAGARPVGEDPARRPLRPVRTRFSSLRTPRPRSRPRATELPPRRSLQLRFLVGLGLGLATLGCSRRPSGPLVEEDLTELSTYVRLPKGVEGARWLIRGFPSTARSLPKQDGIPARGVAYLVTRPAFWSHEGAALSPGNAIRRKFIEADAVALFPASVVASGTPSDGWLELGCVQLDTTTLSAGARVTEALRCGDGLVVSFSVK